MNTFRTIQKITMTVLISASIISCADDKDNDIITPEINYDSHLINITDNVIVETYSDLANKASILFHESVDFKNDQTISNFDEVKQAWRDARAPWEQSEGFLFGPVDTNGVDPSIDSWPVNEVDLNAVLASTDVLTETYIDNGIFEIKGFHTIEYLLWGIDGNKELSDFTVREFEYLIAATENLKNRTTSLKDSWVNGYAANFKNAGNGGSDFISQNSALETLVAGLIAIADEVATGKIEDPLNGNAGSSDQTKEESRFSHNSKTDFSNNIKSISNIYNGKYLADGMGLSDIIKIKNADLDTSFNEALISAINAIDNIPGTFTSAIDNNRTEVANAQEKVLNVLILLKSEISPIIKNL